jgi:hypothetical protein
MGIPLVIVALMIEAGIGPVQEYCLRTFDTPKAALVGYAYFGGCIINLVTAAYSGDVEGAWSFLHEQADARAERGEPQPMFGMATPFLLVLLLATVSFFGISLIGASQDTGLASFLYLPVAAFGSLSALLCDSLDRRRVWSGSGKPRGHGTESILTGRLLPVLSEALYGDAWRGGVHVFRRPAVELAAPTRRETERQREAQGCW